MKWYTKTEYVDQQTGEMLEKHEVQKQYIIIKKIKNHEQKHNWSAPNWNGTRTREEYGITTITNICTKQGKQQRLWED